MNARSLTKLSTGVAATALVCAGLLGTAGAALAAPATSPSASVTVSSIGSVTLTGKIISVGGKLATVVLDGSNDKITITWTDPAKVIGALNVGAHVKIVTTLADALLKQVKADVITVLSF